MMPARSSGARDDRAACRARTRTRSNAALLVLAGCALATAACRQAAAPEPSTSQADAATVHPEVWPAASWPLAADPALESRVQALLGKMTLEQKVGQVIQADIASVTPEDVRTYHLGSVLNGGGSGPGGDDVAAPGAWLALADAFYRASIDTSGGGAGIPVLWGTDAVHGHNNIVGATLFPHNVGLGAMRDPELMTAIAAATAREVRTTGMDWTFAPSVAVPQDIRWGRTYEGYSEDPAIVASYAAAFVRGLQGDPADADFLRDGHVLATVKHFLGDGGTDEGHDQGDARIPESVLRDIHAAGYPPAIGAGVQTIMASFSSWNGAKMHGNRGLLTGVLKERMNFQGFIVGDWNAHGQLPGCRNDDCPQALLAGLDMYMAPDSWRGLHASLLAEARSGTVPRARLDDAVARILRVKFRMGQFEAGPPSTRPLGGRFNLLGAPAHRATARSAVRKSLVLLKNVNGTLPLAPGRRVLVAGDGADNLAKQSGGWTIGWQGTDLDNSRFPGATSIWKAVSARVATAGGRAELSIDGRFTRRPDVAIVVFGENPYAEGRGDLSSLALATDAGAHLELMRRLRAAGIPIVAVLLSGRPLWMNREINLADAFVAAWLPGSEGAGVADVLLTTASGTVAYDFTGRLPFSWPRHAARAPGAGPGVDALFPVGYGLTYANPGQVPQLPEDPGETTTNAEGRGSPR